MSTDLPQRFGPVLSAVYIGPGLKSKLNVDVYGAAFYHGKLTVNQAVADPLVVGRDHRVEPPSPFLMPVGEVEMHGPVSYEHTGGTIVLHHVTL